MGRSNRPQAVRCMVGGLTVLGKLSIFLLFVAFPCCIAALVQGESASAPEGLHMCRGSCLWCSSFGFVVCALSLSMVLSQMCRAVALT
jgi:hypothetical protein